MPHSSLALRKQPSNCHSQGYPVLVLGRVWQLGSGPKDPVRGQGGDMILGGGTEAFYSLLRQKIIPLAISDWGGKKGTRHTRGLFLGTSIALHSCATLCLIHSVPSLQTFAMSLPQDVGIFSVDSTLCPWSMSELGAKSPACSKAYPFFSGQSTSLRGGYCKEYHQASF